MPQMSPISWLTLFLLFSFSFITFNIMNYYCINSSKSNTNLNFNKNINMTNKNSSLNWKW